MKPFSCSLCPSTFTQRGNLLRHIATIHEGKKRTDVPSSKVAEESYDIGGNLKFASTFTDKGVRYKVKSATLYSCILHRVH